MMHIFRRWGAADVLIAFAVLTLGLTQTAHAAGNPVRLTMAPVSASVEAGKSVVFTVTGIDGAGESRDVTVFSSFSTDDPYGNTAQNTYTAGKVGSWTVTATMGGLSATSKVTVTPGPLATLIINPDSSPELLAPGEHRTFSALAYDAYNNRLANPEVLWSVENNVGTIDQSGRFTATHIGTGNLRVQGPNNIGDVITIKVREGVTGTTNTNSGATTNTNVNSNANANTNTNAAANTNTNTNSVKGDDTQITGSTAAATASCKSFSTLQWSLLLLAYAVLVAAYYVIMRTTANSWWWLPPALLTAGGLWLFSDRRCESTYAWWPYALLGLGIVLSAIYLWLRPRREQLGIKL